MLDTTDAIMAACALVLVIFGVLWMFAGEYAHAAADFAMAAFLEVCRRR